MPSPSPHTHTVANIRLPPDEIIAKVSIIREKVIVIITGHPKTLECNRRDLDDNFGLGYCRCEYHYRDKPGYPLYIIDLDKNEVMLDANNLDYEVCRGEETEFLLPPGTKGMPKITDNGVIFQMLDDPDGTSSKVVHKYFSERVWESLEIPNGMFSCETWDTKS